MSCPPALYFNESGTVMQITPLGNNSGTLALVNPAPNPGPGGPYLSNQPFLFVVIGHVATCTFASNAFGFISTVPGDIIAAFNGDPVMSMLGVAAAVGVATLPDAQINSWSCITAVNIILGLKGMKIYKWPPRS